MADKYLYSGAGGAGTGADWANAYTTMTAAVAGMAAGDNLWVAHDHAESTAGAVTLNMPGSSANPTRVMCVDRAGSVPPVAADLRTTASVTTTGANALTIGTGTGFGGRVYYYGIAFNCGTGATSAALTVNNSANASMEFVFERCKLAKKGTTGVTAAIIFGVTNTGQNQRAVLIDTTLEFGSTADTAVVRSMRLEWRNTASAIAGATIPTTLFGASSSQGEIVLVGVDLSAVAGTIFAAINVSGELVLQDCRLHASATIKAAANNPAAAAAYVIRSDSGGINYRHERHGSFGSQVVETTIIRSGGASDGATPISWKIVTTSNADTIGPFEAMPIVIWVDGTSAVTLTVYGIWGGGAVPTQDDIWFDVAYLGSASYPLASFATAGKASQLATAASHSADGSTWGGSTTPFKMTAAFTPAQKGFVTVWVRAATPSATFYIDPKIEVA